MKQQSEIRIKLRLIPFNLVWCLPTFFIFLFGLTTLFTEQQTYVIASIAYIYDVVNTCKLDYLELQIKKLNEKTFPNSDSK